MHRITVNKRCVCEGDSLRLRFFTILAQCYLELNFADRVQYPLYGLFCSKYSFHHLCHKICKDRGDTCCNWLVLLLDSVLLSVPVPSPVNWGVSCSHSRSSKPKNHFKCCWFRLQPLHYGSSCQNLVESLFALQLVWTNSDLTCISLC